MNGREATRSNGNRQGDASSKPSERVRSTSKLFVKADIRDWQLSASSGRFVRRSLLWGIFNLQHAEVLHAIAREVGLSDLPGVFADLLAGRARGRTVVKVHP